MSDIKRPSAEEKLKRALDLKIKRLAKKNKIIVSKTKKDDIIILDVKKEKKRGKNRGKKITLFSGYASNKINHWFIF